MPVGFQMDGSLARAARHLTQVSARIIAQQAGVETADLRKYELGGDALSDEDIQRVTNALAYYGAVFIPEDSFGGVGVRRKFNRSNVEMIEDWEGEGGTVADDDT